MSQILHIFRKDARHRWIEILGSLVLLALYAWREAKSWGPSQHAFPDLVDWLWGLTIALVPIAWCFLTVRVVHDENLVGDRQFWVTRPYDWKKLLAAKALFVLVFVNVPALIVGMLLLKAAGFSPTRHIGGLLGMQLRLWLFMTVTAMAAAAITAGIPQVLLIAVAVMVYLIGVGSLVEMVPGSGMSAGNSVSGSIALVVMMGVCAAVVVWQYARRETWKTRGLTIGGAVAVAVILAATPYRWLIERAYPASGSREPSPVVLSLRPTDEHSPKKGAPLIHRKQVTLIFSLRPTGVAEGSIVRVDGREFTVTAADGTRWSSGWQSGGVSDMWPDRDKAHVVVQVPADFFDRAKAGPSRVAISFALSVYREENFRGVEVQRGEFAVPGVGICGTRRWGFTTELQCRSPLKAPAVIGSIDTSTQTCPPVEDKPPAPPGLRLTAENWGESSGPAGLAINPVQAFSLVFWNWADASNKFSSPGACPGTPVALSSPILAQRARAEVEFPALRLEDYAQRGEWGDGNTGFFIGW